MIAEQTFTKESLEQTLSHQTGLSVILRINNNRKTMLNMLERSFSRVLLSIHQLFLRATDTVITALSQYINGRTTKKVRQVLQSFIHEQIQDFDYSKRLDNKELVTQGAVYDLQSIYDNLNATYFANTLDLRITWYGRSRNKNRSRVTFGTYDDTLKLIRIHRRLDTKQFPRFYVEFVIYHEMVHHVVPPQISPRGHTRYHGKEFKELEKQFAHYEQAMQWEKEHKHTFFSY